MLPQFLRDRWVAWRNRLLSSGPFQRWAAGFPLTRPIAHRKAQDLFDLVSGFVYSQTILAVVQLDIQNLLAEGPLTTEAIATATELPLEGAERLLAAAASIGITEPAGPGRYALGEHGAALRGNGGLADMIRHNALLYKDLTDPVAMLRSGGGDGALARFWPYATSERPEGAAGAEVSSYSSLMAATQPMVAADILHAYPLHGHRLLMDVGGGEGAFALAAARHAPNLMVRVFDLPAVAERARNRFQAEGLGSRADAVGGDFLADPLPGGADIISLVRILHDHSDAGCMAVLRSIRSALGPDGTLMVAEPMSDAPRRDPMAEAYFGFYLLAMGRGRARRPAEIADFCRAAGFTRIQSMPTRTPMLVRVLIARP